MSNRVHNFLTIMGGKRNVKKVLNYLKSDDGKQILEKIRRDYNAAVEDLEFHYVESFSLLYEGDDNIYHFQVDNNTIYFYTPMDSPGGVVRYLSTLFPSIVFKYEVDDCSNYEERGYVKYLAGNQIEYKNVFWRHVGTQLLEEEADYQRDYLYNELFADESPSPHYIARGSEETSSDEVTVSSPSETTYDSQEIDDLPF